MRRGGATWSITAKDSLGNSRCELLSEPIGSIRRSSNHICQVKETAQSASAPPGQSAVAPSWLSSPARVASNKLPSSGARAPTSTNLIRRQAGCYAAPDKDCPCCQYVKPGEDVASACPQKDLRNADLRNASFEGAILQDMNIECAVFDGAELKSVSFMKSHGKGASFRHARMEGAVFDEAKLDSPDFTFASLLSSSFQFTVFTGVSFFNNANIEGAPTRTGPCTCNAVGLLSSRRGDARVALPSCPTTLRVRGEV